MIQRNKLPESPPALTQINAGFRRRHYPKLMKRPSFLSAAVVGVALVTSQVAASSAAPQQLRCALASSQAAQNQSIVVVFDDDAKTLQAQSGTQTYSFTDVSISNVAISGSAGEVSLGIDRSSLGMVWQQYAPEKATIEYGSCQSAASTADH